MESAVARACSTFITALTGFRPHCLEVEITESALVKTMGAAQNVIDDLRRAGVRIALDDFGTGYATLTQLLSFHLDKLKIDRSFVSCLDQSEDSQVIVRAIVGIAKGFGLTTTAEGIEDAGQLAILKANGCAEGQGYLFSRAVPVAEIPALLRHAGGTLPRPKEGPGTSRNAVRKPHPPALSGRESGDGFDRKVKNAPAFNVK